MADPGSDHSRSDSLEGTFPEILDEMNPVVDVTDSDQGHATGVSLFELPSELIVHIVEMLPPDAFIDFAFASYALLHFYFQNLVPGLSVNDIVYLTAEGRNSESMFPRMPPEIILQIMGHLDAFDIMSFVIADYHDLMRQGIAPTMTTSIMQGLRRVVRFRRGWHTGWAHS